MRTLCFIVDGQQLKQDPACDFDGIVSNSRGYLLALVSVQSGNVEAVGAAQVQNVQDEGNTQVAELAAFAALRSVKPTTTILNDSGAHMAVEYVADTKLYIDRKLAGLLGTE